MKIYSMTATFGKLQHETLTLQPGLNIVHAPNEWGKSTWCAFLVAMLYGMETRTHTTRTALADKDRYAPWSGAPMSGRIDLNWNGKDITIERRSKGRSVFSEFKAYETATGLSVAGLTGNNCGQVLLGVEKSVFLRSGFLRLTDLPVTQDESLRSRLNALVTTGDESGTADMLAQKLKELKNRCRFNRTGLLPQAQAQRSDLAHKLRELSSLQEQQHSLSSRKMQLRAESTNWKITRPPWPLPQPRRMPGGYPMPSRKSSAGRRFSGPQRTVAPACRMPTRPGTLCRPLRNCSSSLPASTVKNRLWPSHRKCQACPVPSGVFPAPRQ